MRWKRGFFRIWIALATIWVLSTASFAYVDITSTGRLPGGDQKCWDRLALWPDGKSFGPWDLFDEPDSEENIAINKKNGEWQPESIKARNEWRAAVTQKLWDCEARLPVITRAGLLWADYHSSIEKYSAVGLLPPITLFAIGMAFIWVVKGFSRDEAKHSADVD